MTLPAPIYYKQRSSLRRGLMAGIYGLGRSTGDILHFLGAENTGQRVHDFFDEKVAENPIDADLAGKTVFNNPEILTDPDWWMYNIGQMAPTIAATIGTGGAAGAAVKGIGLGAKAAALAGSVVGGTAGGALEGASTYRQALDEGKSESEARAEGAAMGIGTGLLNAIPTYKLFKPPVTGVGKATQGVAKKVTKAITRSAGQAALEAGTEYLEEPWESIVTGEPITEGLKRGLDVIGPAFVTGAASAATPHFHHEGPVSGEGLQALRQAAVEDYVNNPVQSQSYGVDYVSETMAVQNVPDDVATVVDSETLRTKGQELRSQIRKDRENVEQAFKEGNISDKEYERAQRDANLRLEFTRRLEARSGVAPVEAEVRSAYELYSDSEEENMDFQRASEALISPRHSQFRTLSQDIDAMTGMESSTEDAIGDWEDGAENSLATFVKNATVQDVAYNAAWKGLVGHQKSVLTFVKGEGGTDTMFSFALPETVENSRKVLSEHGVGFRTLIPQGTKTRVMVFDQGNQLTPQIQELANRYGIEIEAHVGQGQYLGANTREDAANVFRNTIREYEEGNNPLRYRPPGGVRSDRDFTENEAKVDGSVALTDDGGVGQQMRAYIQDRLHEQERYSGWTESHSIGVGRQVRELAQFLGIDADRTTMATMASLLHDQGKLDVPKALLNKQNKLTPDEIAEFNRLIDKEGRTEAESRRMDQLANQLGRLSSEERELFREHTEKGELRLRDAPGVIGASARALARYHHDSPQQIRGMVERGALTQEQGFMAGIVHLADVFESMSGQGRPYALYDKEGHVIARSRGNALRAILETPGSFEPALVKALVSLQLRDHAEEFTSAEKRGLRSMAGIPYKALTKEELNVEPRKLEMVRRNAFSRSHGNIIEKHTPVSSAPAAPDVVDVVNQVLTNTPGWPAITDAGHRDAITSAFRDLFDAGLPRQAINLIGKVSVLSDTADHAAYNVRTKEIGFNAEILNAVREAPMGRSLRALRADLAHEVGHAVDYSGQGQISSSSPLFSAKDLVSNDNVNVDGMGPVLREMYEAYQGDKGGLKQLLRYPFARIGSQDTAVLQRESFAQLASLYYEYPEAVQKYVPTGFKLMEDINNALRTQRRADLDSAIRGAFQAPGANLGTSADAGVGNSPIVAAITGDRDAHSPVPGASPNTGERGRGSIDPPALKTLGATVGIDEMALAAKRDVRPHELTKAVASRLGASESEVDRFARRSIGRSFNAEELAQATTLLDKTVSDFRKFTQEYVTRIAEGRATSLDDQAFIDQKLNFATIQGQFIGVSGEAGRALNILRLSKDTAGRAEYIKMAFGTSEDIRLQAQLINTLDPVAAAKITRETSQPTNWDKFMEAWINGLLSGPQTHVANSVSNLIVSALEDVERFVGSAFGAFHTGDKVTFSEAMARTYGNIDGTVAGLAAAAKALRSEDAVDLFGKLEGGAYKKAISGAKGVAIRLPGRFLSAEDMFFKALTVSKEYRALAMRESKTKGGNFDELIASPRQDLMDKAWDAARVATFTNPLGDIGQAVQRVLSKHPYMRLIAPFIRTPSNIVKFVAKRTPAGFMFHDVQTDIKAGGAARDMALARITEGTGIGMAVFSLALGGLFSGKGPDDRNQRSLMYQTGWQPYSVKIGDKWVSYSRLEPFGMLVGMAADMAEMASVMNEKEAGELMAMFVGSFAKNMTSKTYLRGMSEMFEAMSDPDRYGKQWIMNYAGTAVPTGIAQIARSRDPYLRKADSILDKIKERIPGLRETLPEKIDLYGNPIKVEGSIGPDLLSVLYVSTQKDDKVSQEMLRLGIFKAGVSKRIAGVELTPDEYAEYQRIAGKMAREYLQSMVNSDGWKSLSDKSKEDMIQDIFTKQRAKARKLLMQKFPDIQQRKMEQ